MARHRFSRVWSRVLRPQPVKLPADPLTRQVGQPCPLVRGAGRTPGTAAQPAVPGGGGPCWAGGSLLRTQSDLCAPVLLLSACSSGTGPVTGVCSVQRAPVVWAACPFPSLAFPQGPLGRLSAGLPSVAW